VQTFEIAVLNFIQDNFRCGFLDLLMPIVTQLGDVGLVWILTALALLPFQKCRNTGVIMLCALAAEAVICNLMIKPLTARIRPYDINTAVELLIGRLSDYSFPSGHTAASFTAASVLFFRRTRLWIPATVLAVLIAFSRLYLYMHYPTDVLAGALLGTLIGYLCCRAAAHILPGEKCRKTE
jgi:undecaprenyl-diphosphatase